MEGKEFPGHLIHQAVHWDNPDLLQDLLSGDQRHFIDSTDCNGRTALHVAVDQQNITCAKILLEAGADPDALGPSLGSSDETRLSQIETALHIAVRKRDYSLTSCLLQAGSSANIPIMIIGSDDCEKQTSSALREACRIRDASLVDLLIRFGARDDDGQALKLSSNNNDYHLMSKLLSLKSFTDPEFKISKKALELPGFSSNTTMSTNSNVFSNSVTFSSMFPTTAVMINWHGIGHNSIPMIRKSWLIDAALCHNVKLKLNTNNQSISLLAITRLDLSNNGFKKVPLCVFQLPSLRILTLSQNKLECLPETETHVSEVSSSNNPSRIRKSSSYNCSLTSASSSSPSSSMSWILPCLEELHLQDNRLESIPACLFDLPSLQLLDLSNNKLRCIPNRIWFAPKLRDLNLSMNLLRDLPSKSNRGIAQSGNSAASLTESVIGEQEDEDTQSEHSSQSPNMTAVSKVTKSPQQQQQRRKQSSPVSPSKDFMSQQQQQLKNKNRSSSMSQSQSIFYTKLLDQESQSSSCNNPEDNIERQSIIHKNLFTSQVVLAKSSYHEEELQRSQSCPLSLLNLSHNGFTSIPSVLSCVAINLSRLNLSYNCLTQIGCVKMYPCNLRHLDLSYNQLVNWCHVEMSGEAETSHKCCCNMDQNEDKNDQDKNKKSYCSRRQHVRLDNLRSLVLSNNQLSNINLLPEDNDMDEFEHLSQKKHSRIMFPNLSMLDLANNNIKEIPLTISDLTNLSVLHLSGNIQISRLPPEMGLLSKLWNLSLKGCTLNEPLKSMVECKKYKTMDIIGYLKSVLEDSKPYARMKLMVVGLQGIGKTSLLEQLRQEGYGSYRKRPPEHWAKRMGQSKSMNLKTPKGVTLSTVGVDVCDWTIEKKTSGNKNNPSSSAQQNFGPVTFRTWDFGGQKEYYSTHQYFLSKRSLYLVVWKMVDGEKAVDGIQQWLVNIQARAPNSPVIIVGTHYDLVKEFFPPFYSQELQQVIRDKFINLIDADKCGLPRVIDSIEVSTKTKHNIKLLCNLIYDTVFGIRCPGSKERLLEQKIPASYLALEEVVNHLAQQRISQGKDPVLKSDEYKHLVTLEMHKKFKVCFRDACELQQATSFLHENGVLLHYEDSTLKDLYFLDPQWLCDILAHVVTVREINPYARNGIMSTDDLRHLFKSSSSTPADMKSYIVNLLNKFEVALTWDSRTLLIPSLLPTERSMISGSTGADVRIPVRSRGWGIRGKMMMATVVSQESKDTSSCSSPKHEAVTGSPKSSNDPKICEQQQTPSPVKAVIEERPTKSIYRLLLMTYFPSGFWSRLMTRILGDDFVIEIIRSFYTIPKDNESKSLIASANMDSKAEWICWQTGLALKYYGDVIFRVKEILPGVMSSGNSINYLSSNDSVKFFVNQDGTWQDICINKSSILEIFIPNHCIRIEDNGVSTGAIMTPNPEYVTKLLSLTVDHIDTLLEDWYPSLGTRFVHTSQGRFLVTRIVPCIHCMHVLSQQQKEHQQESCRSPTTATATTGIDFQFNPGTPDRKDVIMFDDRRLTAASSATIGSKSSTASADSCYESATSSRTASSNVPAEVAEQSRNTDTISNQNEQTCIPVYCFLMEECILKGFEESRMRCPVHADLSLKRIAPDTVFVDLGQHYLIKSDLLRRGKMLGRGAFGFVFRATIKSKSSNSNNNTVQEVAMKMLQPVDPGTGAKKSDNVAYKVAYSKWERDPMQHSCKAYCDARREISILISLRHPHIVPLIGVCTKPLALILQLAPLGALDVLIKEYRRSGAQMNVLVIQKILLQVSRALEYLHQQHIIYRDLKSENILVWKMYRPHEVVQMRNGLTCNIETDVDVKLADYGISRSTLPTGTKGFGGTEGFMAPEIMRFNGEEEYTEKVDCFSFGMFIYELIALRLPFEGQECVKDNILDGGRPSLTQRDTSYPTNLLDLMVLCWNEAAKDRPTASQIVSIISAPEFVHQLDTIPLIGFNAILSSDIFVRENDNQEQTESVNKEIWLSRLGKQTEVLTIGQQQQHLQNNFIDYKVIKSLNKVTITSIRVVKDEIWCGDSCSMIHVVDSETFDVKQRIRVSDALTAVTIMEYSNLMDSVIICTTNGKIYSCDMVSRDVKEIDNDGITCHTLTMIESTSGSYSELWTGGSEGIMQIHSVTNDAAEKKAVKLIKQVTHYDSNTPVLERNDVFHLISNQDHVYTYLYPGCLIFQWDVKERRILHQLDISKLAPCSESLMSISIEEQMSQDNCQVTCMSLINDELFVSTTLGVLVVIESQTLRPITVFRPHEHEIKAILAFEEKNSCTSTKQASPDRRTSIGSNKSTSSIQQQEDCNAKNNKTDSKFIVTIGKGCRNLMSRYVINNMTTEESGGSLSDTFHAILWSTGSWQ